MIDKMEIIKLNLSILLSELADQEGVGKLFPSSHQSYDEQIDQIREYIDDAKEYGIAYEGIVCLLEDFPFQISGRASVKLLEVGLMMGFKTDRPQDNQFALR